MRSSWRAAFVVGVLLVARLAGAGEAPTDCLPADLKLRVAFESPKQLADALQELTRGRTREAKRVQLEARLREAGCDVVERQSDPSLAEPNVLCRIGNGSRETIVVGASPWPDGWQSAALLPSLARAIGAEPRRHEFVLAAFGRSVQLQPGGARVYLDHAPAPPRLFLHFASLGFEAPIVGADTNPSQRCLMQSVARAVGTPIGALTSWDWIYYPCGEASWLSCVSSTERRDLDTFPFHRRGVEIAGLYGVKEEKNAAARHRSSPRLDPLLYVASYRILAAYVVALDAALAATAVPGTEAP
jgi:hypothetical protein